MYKQNHLCEIVSINQIAPNIIDVTVTCNQIAAGGLPGQFLNILCENNSHSSLTLRRPISICDIEQNNIRFIFEVKGKGTSILANKKAGEFLDIMGPLGNGFSTEQTGDAIVVGGGIGVFPLLLLSRVLSQRCRVVTCLGFRNGQSVVLEDNFKSTSDAVHITTDDGSYANHGLVTELLEQNITTSTGVVYACGPLAMLKGVADICATKKIKCQVSLEQRMGCGIGACLVCACANKKQDQYLHVCKDGPVFWSEEVLI